VGVGGWGGVGVGVGGWGGVGVGVGGWGVCGGGWGGGGGGVGGAAPQRRRRAGKSACSAWCPGTPHCSWSILHIPRIPHVSHKSAFTSPGSWMVENPLWRLVAHAKILLDAGRRQDGIVYAWLPWLLSNVGPHENRFS
jgi:hypothetical protein